MLQLMVQLVKQFIIISNNNTTNTFILYSAFQGT